MRYLAVAVFCLLYTLPHPAIGKDAPTRIIASEWGVTLKADGSGFYNELARLILKDGVGATDYRITPYRRSTSLFLSTPEACKYPDSITTLKSDGHIETSEGLLESIPVINVHVHIFGAPGTRPPRSIEELKGHTIAYPMGARTPLKLKDPEIEFVAVADELSKAKMLLTGRVELMAAALPDLRFVLTTLGHPMLPYFEPFIVENLPLGFVCRDSAANRAFLERLNTRISELHKDGDLALFFLHHGLDPHGYAPASSE